MVPVGVLGVLGAYETRTSPASFDRATNPDLPEGVAGAVGADDHKRQRHDHQGHACHSASQFSHQGL